MLRPFRFALMFIILAVLVGGAGFRLGAPETALAGPEVAPGAGAAVQTIAVAAPDFKPVNTNVTYAYMGNGISLLADSTLAGFFGRLQLPQGAVITGYTGYLTDPEATANLQIAICQFDTVTGLPTMVGQMETVADSAAIQAVTNNDISVTVDNSRYVYYVYVRPSAVVTTIKINGAQVRYTLPTASFLPAVAQ